MLRMVFMNAVVFCGAFLLTYRVFRIKGLLNGLLAFIIFYFAQIVFTLTVLGMAGALYLGNAVILNLLILVVIWVSSGKRRSTFIFPPEAGKRAREALKNKAVLACVAVITAFGISKVCVNLVNPPSGWDSLNYHFTFAVEWLKSGGLGVPPTVFDDPSPSYYPLNGSLIYLWYMLPLKNVFLADLGQIPFFLLAVLAVYGIARKLDLSREHSFYSAALFLLIPNFFKHLQVAYVDAMVAGLFLAGVYILFLLREDYSWQNTLIFGLSQGLLLGVKTVALPYCLILLVPFGYLSLKNYRKLYLVCPALLVIVALGGFSYIRNFMETGNPLYPLHFALWGKTIFPGVMERAVYKVHFKPEDYSPAKMLFHEGLGAQTLLFVLPAFFLGLPVTLVKKIKQLDLFLAYFLLMPLLIYLVYYFVIPLANLRYLYPLLGLGIAIGLFTARNLKIPDRVLRAAVIICILVSMGELAKRQELVSGIILSFTLFLLIPVMIKAVGKVPAKAALSLIFSAALFIGLALLNMDYNKHEYSRYLKMRKYSGFWPDALKAWEWLNNHTENNNIAYAGRPVPLPLYGTNFKNNVFYVSVNATEPAKLHYFRQGRYQWQDEFASVHKSFEEPGNYRSQPDYAAWLRNLQKRNADHLFVYSLHQTREICFPLEDTWARNNPGAFTPVLENPTVHIYRIAK